MIVAAAILVNTTTNRYHPILFRDAPMPGGGVMDARRLKSYGHHTEGFTTHEEAAASLTGDERIAGATIDTTHLIPWDGDDLPASVAFLSPDGLLVC